MATLNSFCIPTLQYLEHITVHTLLLDRTEWNTPTEVNMSMLQTGASQQEKIGKYPLCYYYFSSSNNKDDWNVFDVGCLRN
jgi:hypothetical protein